MIINFIIQALVALAINIVAYLITPKPKKEKPAEVQDLDLPTAEQGRPIPVIFGTVTIESPNVIWYGEKIVGTRQVNT